LVTPFLGLFIYLTPSVPLSFQGEGGVLGRGASPLLDAPLVIASKERRSGV